MKVLFTRFWVDDYTALRRTLDEAAMSGVDKVVTTLGCASFIPPLAHFPVRYLDKGLAVFRFPPLASDISVIQVSPEDLPL